jgi:signal transduction histidine kinase
MDLSQALRLLGFSIGGVLQFSLIVLVRRYRPIRKLEILLLWLVGCLLAWNTCNLLRLTIGSTEGVTQMTRELMQLAPGFIAYCALWFVPSFLLHTHLALGRAFFPWRGSWLFRFAEVAVYFPLLALPIHLPAFDSTSHVPDTRFFATWLAFALLASAIVESLMLRRSRKKEQRRLLWVLAVLFAGTALLILYSYWVEEYQPEWQPAFETLLMICSIIPSAILTYTVFQYRFLDVVIDRSIGYMLAVILFLMIYIAGVSGVRDFLQRTIRFPPMVVDVGMILALFAFFQPVRRWIDASVDAYYASEITKFETLAARLDEASRTTVEVERLLRIIEDLLQRELRLRQVRILIYAAEDGKDSTPDLGSGSGDTKDRIYLPKGRKIFGEIQISEELESLSTEQRAGLRFLVSQIVTAIETCRLSEGKILLERELAERDKMATLGQMAATVAHNIKNPLSSIKTIVQLMQEDREINNRYTRDLTLINNEIDRLTHSVNQLLKFSKPKEAVDAEVDLHEVLERVFLVFQPDAQKKGIALELLLESAPLMVRGNAEVLAEVFQNLVLNAIEISPPQTRVQIRAFVQAEEQKKTVLAHVVDEGPGISPEIRQHIFKPFFTTKQKGTGLGLAIVQRRVLDMDGQIHVVSPVFENRGTRFELIFPGTD